VFPLASVDDHNRFALGGSPFTIHIFIGEGMIVGNVYNFSAQSQITPEGCDNCLRQEEARTLSTGQVPITNALLHELEDDTKSLTTLEPEEVGKYLRGMLHWKVTKVRFVKPSSVQFTDLEQAGEPVPLERIPSLRVSLAVGTGDHYEADTKLSKYHSYRVMHSVTEGRPGGLSQGDSY
jgi:tyrosinase